MVQRTGNTPPRTPMSSPRGNAGRRPETRSRSSSASSAAPVVYFSEDFLQRSGSNSSLSSFDSALSSGGVAELLLADPHDQEARSAISSMDVADLNALMRMYPQQSGEGAQSLADVDVDRQILNSIEDRRAQLRGMNDHENMISRDVISNILSFRGADRDLVDNILNVMPREGMPSDLVGNLYDQVLSGNYNVAMSIVTLWNTDRNTGENNFEIRNNIVSFLHGRMPNAPEDIRGAVNNELCTITQQSVDDLIKAGNYVILLRSGNTYHPYDLESLVIQHDMNGQNPLTRQPMRLSDILNSDPQDDGRINAYKVSPPPQPDQNNHA